MGITSILHCMISRADQQCFGHLHVILHAGVNIEYQHEGPT